MDEKQYTKPLDLKTVIITDDFWKNEIELVRKEVIPYQWDALNDNVPGAAPSFCMRNFKIAGRMNEEKSSKGDSYVAPSYTFRGFEALPEDPKNPDPDKFYGFVFQDSDFSKWIEAVGYSLIQHPDKNLEAIADEAIDIVVAAQQEDGYLDCYYIINGRDKTFSNLRDHHELYCFGHLVEGAVAYYEATGKDKLLNAAKRFADYIDSCFGPEEGKLKGYPGHEIAEMALIRLYEVTGEEKYFKLSKFFIDERGKRPYYFDSEGHPCIDIKDKNERYMYNQAHRPVRQQDEAVGHAVRGVYLYSGMADVARISGDEALYKACEKLWDNIVNKKMYITGAIGATHLGEAFSFEYDLPNDTAYAETCASIGLIFFARRLLEIKADSKYSDVLERVLYNGVLSGMALDGKSFFYVNPLEVNPKACSKDERKFHVKPIRQKWFGCACCPPNIARLLGSIGSYAYTENDESLFIHLYMGAKLEKTVDGKKVNIEICSELPWSGNVKIFVKADKTPMTLALRIPGWCNGNYSILGTEDCDSRTKDGYLYLNKDWEDDVITIAFEMLPEFIESKDEVSENYGKVACVRGPIVYCIEEKDNGPALHQLLVEANSSIDAEIDEICGNSCVVLYADGNRRYSDSSVNESLYHKLAPKKIEKTKIKFVPYYMWANRGENEMRVWLLYD